MLKLNYLLLLYLSFLFSSTWASTLEERIAQAEPAKIILRSTDFMQGALYDYKKKRFYGINTKTNTLHKLSCNTPFILLANTMDQRDICVFELGSGEKTYLWLSVSESTPCFDGLLSTRSRYCIAHNFQSTDLLYTIGAKVYHILSSKQPAIY